uniref:Trafficking protein particle complex subunit 14 n=1 Tax=Oncorhynchus mykiss TaxID=8022 RepID=A0A8C7LZ39_ONCMY
MESQCEYFMYFPAVPITDLSDPSKYRTLPRRSHLYLGETVQFLLVLRSRDERSGSDGTKGNGDSDCGTRAWKELVGSLSAVASVCPGESRHRSQIHPHEFQRSYSDDGADEDPDEVDFAAGTSPMDKPVVLNDEVIFPLTVSLDKLHVNTLKVKIVVTVWKQEKEKAEIREHGYLTILQLRSPTHTFRQDLNTFKAQVSTTLSVLPPPTVKCQQITVSGKHLTLLKVLNSSSQEEVCVRNVRVLPNFNASYLPMMPDGSVLLVDNVCHQSAEVTMASFHRMNSSSSHLPSMLSALEEQNFLFQLQLRDQPEEESSEGLEVPLVAVLQWSTSKLPFTRYISTHYQLPSVRLDRPRLVMTASCQSSVRPLEHFRVKYTLLNNLQDFLAVRLVWTPEGRGRQEDPSASSVVCHSPLNNLGQCRKGSTLSFTVAFQILKAGLFELSQHMKLKLQFTASCSNPPAEARPMSLSRHNSPSSPAVRDLLDRQSLGRSQSFSHQQPSRSHLTRTGSVMERRAITPPVGSPVGRPLYLPSERPVLSLDKIAKRECKVLVIFGLPFNVKFTGFG